MRVIREHQQQTLPFSLQKPHLHPSVAAQIYHGTGSAEGNVYFISLRCPHSEWVAIQREWNDWFSSTWVRINESGKGESGRRRRDTVVLVRWVNSPWICGKTFMVGNGGGGVGDVLWEKEIDHVGPLCARACSLILCFLGYLMKYWWETWEVRGPGWLGVGDVGLGSVTAASCGSGHLCQSRSPSDGPQPNLIWLRMSPYHSRWKKYIKYSELTAKRRGEWCRALEECAARTFQTCHNQYLTSAVTHVSLCLCFCLNVTGQWAYFTQSTSMRRTLMVPDTTWDSFHDHMQLSSFSGEKGRER